MSSPQNMWDLAQVFAHSPSFWSQTMPLIVATLACASAIVALLIWRTRALRVANPRRRPFARDEGGSAQAMDFVLTFPIALLVGLLFIQFLMAAQASLVVHYAAYCAARTARTIYWDMSVSHITSVQMTGDIFGGLGRAQGWRVLKSRNEARARAKAAISARTALMAAVPSSQVTPGATPADGALVLKEIGLLNVRTVAARNKANYAFAASNVTVRVEVSPAFSRGALASNLSGLRVDALPIHAQVTFRYPLRMPVGRLLGTRALNGSYYREMTAHVQVI